MRRRRILAMALALCVAAACMSAGWAATSQGGDGTHVHTYVYDYIYEPTCTEAGLRIKTCSGCREVYEEETVPALGHRWGSWITRAEATCTQAGSQVRTCGRCGETQTRAVGALGHNYAGWVTTQEATCTSHGQEAGTCTRCGARGTRQTPLKAHTYGEWEITVPPTDFSQGTRERTCQVCGNSQAENYDPEGTLRRGDTGDAVKALQDKLNGAGYDCGTADGVFGGKTEAAVSAVEAAHGHTADGVAWPGVLALLDAPVLPPPGPDNITKYGLPVSGGGDPGIDLTITQPPAGHYAAGDVIHLTGTVVNTGPRPLKLTEFHCKESDQILLDWAETPLVPGTEYPFEYVLKVTEADVDDDWFYRFVTAVGADISTGVEVGDTELILAAQQVDGPAIRLLIHDTTGKGGAKGEMIDVDFTCVNVGDVPLKNLMFELRYGDDTYAEDDTIAKVSDPAMLTSFPVSATFTFTQWVAVTDKDEALSAINRKTAVYALTEDEGTTVTDEVDFDLWLADPVPRETPVPAPEETPVPGRRTPPPREEPTPEPTIVVRVPPNPTPEPTPGPTIVVRVPPNPTPKPTPEPTPEPDDGRACVPRLTGRGENTFEITLDYCKDHDLVFDTMRGLLAAAADPAQELTAWRQIYAMWNDQVNALYAAMAQGRPDGEKAVIQAEEDAFFRQLDDRKAALTALYPGDELPAERETALALMNRCVELCYAVHFAPQDRLDSVRTGQYRAMTAAASGANCARKDEYIDDHTLYTHTLCAVHGAMDQQVTGKVLQSAAALTEGRQLWAALLDVAYMQAGRTAERTSFSEWIAAREALLALYYPDKADTAQEVILNAIRQKVLEVCGGK